jgi:hypothetical protein
MSVAAREIPCLMQIMQAGQLDLSIVDSKEGSERGFACRGGSYCRDL